jgi:general secretion pathway protein L
VAETLFIRLPYGGADAAWAVFESDGRLVSAVGRGPLAEARALAAGRRIVVMVPALDVIATQADLPAASQSRLRQIVPYSLEESLADDVEKLTFAIGARVESGATAVAITARARMDAWLAELRDAGLMPQVLCSEGDGVPDVPATLALLIEDDRIYGRRPGQPPFVFDGIDLFQVINLSRGGAPADADLKHAIVYVDAPGRERHRKELASLEQFATADVKLVADGLFAHLAASLAQRPGTNLLQGGYAPKSNWAALAKPWRVAASLLVAAAALGVLSLAAEYWSLRRTDGELTEIVAASCERLVGASRVAACEAEVQQRLGSGRTGTTGEGFLATLNAVAVARSSDTQIDALSYRNGAMDLQLIARDIPAVDEFARHLTETRRFNPVLESSAQEGDKVTFRMKITGKDP